MNEQAKNWAISEFDVQLYLSGNVASVVEGGSTVEEFILRRPCPQFRLMSFAYPKQVIDVLETAARENVRANVIIDSGAFTAWTLGKPVQLKNLMDHNDALLQKWGHAHTFHFIALDIIPGEKGRRATSDEIHAAVEQSYDNFLIMHQHYPNNYVLPVFHSGEEFSLRDKYLNHTDYICISMDQGMSEGERLEWGKRATAPRGFKYHGLAATGNRMVTEIDWYSVDSSSWVTVGSMGGILWPTSDNRFRSLSISDKSPNLKEAGKHLQTLSFHERQAAEAKIRYYGFDPEVLARSPYSRWKWNSLMWAVTPWRRNIKPALDLFEGY